MGRANLGRRHSHFTGKIAWIEIDIDAAAADENHLIGPEERLHLAIARPVVTLDGAATGACL